MLGHFARCLSGTPPESGRLPSLRSLPSRLDSTACLCWATFLRMRTSAAYRCAHPALSSGLMFPARGLKFRNEGTIMKYKLLLREELTLCVLPIVIWWARQETVPFSRATVGILIHASAVMLSYYGCYWRLRKEGPRFAGWVTDGILFTGMVAVFSLSIWGTLSIRKREQKCRNDRMVGVVGSIPLIAQSPGTGDDHAIAAIVGGDYGAGPSILETSLRSMTTTATLTTLASSALHWD